MTRDVYLRGNRLRLDPTKIIGSGGEADVYDVTDAYGEPKALKLWKPPTHPEYVGDNDEAVRNRENAKRRLVENDQKLKVFPLNLTPRVVVPQDLVTTKSGSTVGYTMTMIKGADALRSLAQRKYRREKGIENDTVVRVFQDLHKSLVSLHQAQVVIGDLNPQNVLVRGVDASLIDADSMQFGGFLCRSFTNRYVDPLVCDPTTTTLVQAKPHSDDTDWYAFALLLFESLLFVHPYGGVFEPKDPSQQMPHDGRPLRRISVFHREVVYPKNATPLSWLPQGITRMFAEIFERGKDRRGIFPPDALEILLAHSQGKYVDPSKNVPQVLKQETIRGAVRYRRVLPAWIARILSSALHDGKLLTLHHDGEAFVREGGRTVLSGGLNREMKFRLCGNKTVIAFNERLAVFADGEAPKTYLVDSYQGRRPVFDSNSRHYFWLSGGQLYRDDVYGPRFIGNVLQNQTLFWVGSTFGFGFYRAGHITTGFVFDALKGGVNDSVKLAPIRGELVDAVCYLSSNRAWFFTTTVEGGVTRNYCSVIDATGNVVANAVAIEGDGSWLSGIRGRCAVTISGPGGSIKHQLLVALDRGIVAIEANGGMLFEAASYPDTRDFADPDSKLFVDVRLGVYQVTNQDAHLLQFQLT